MILVKENTNHGPIIGMKAIARYKIYNLQKSSHIKNERMKDKIVVR